MPHWRRHRHRRHATQLTVSSLSLRSARPSRPSAALALHTYTPTHQPYHASVAPPAAAAAAATAAGVPTAAEIQRGEPPSLLRLCSPFVRAGAQSYCTVRRLLASPKVGRACRASPPQTTYPNSIIRRWGQATTGPKLAVAPSDGRSPLRQRLRPPAFTQPHLLVAGPNRTPRLLTPNSILHRAATSLKLRRSGAS